MERKGPRPGAKPSKLEIPEAALSLTMDSPIFCKEVRPAALVAPPRVGSLPNISAM